MLREEGSAALRSPARRPQGREVALVGPAGGVPVGQLSPSSRGGRSRACCRGLSRPLGAPGRGTTSRARAHTHTHTPAHTLTPCCISRLGPRLWEGPGSRNLVEESGGRRERLGPRPRVEAVRHLPSPFQRAGLAPGAATRRPAGVPEAPGRAADGVGGWRGPLAPGRQAARLRAGESLDVGNSLSARPAEKRGRAGPGRGQPGSSCGGRLAPPAPPAGRLPPARGLPPGWAASLRRRSGRPSRGTPRSYLGERPGALPVLQPRDAAWGGSPGAGGRVRSAAAARRSRRESGRERGSRGGVCARVCERGRASGSEGVCVSD